MLIVLGLVLPLLVNSTSSDSPARRVNGTQKPSGRLIEVFNDAFRSSLDSDAAMRLAAQVDDDVTNDPFTPLVSSLMTENTPFGLINLGARIHRGIISSVFEITEFPNLIIKYQVHCSELNLNVHPLLRDAWYMQGANACGISPAVRFVSPPSMLCSERSGKCDFNMASAAWFDCYHNQAALRYMILDKVDGKSLHHFRMVRYKSTNGAMRLSDVMVIGVQLMRVLRQLHEEAKIMHGDIHSPNIMIWMNETSGVFRLDLIDFGLSSNVSNITFPATPVWPLGHWLHQFFTQWQMAGFAWSPRDDVMKGIQTIAHLMHPYEYFAMEREIAERGYRALDSWKLNGNWFVTERFDPVRSLQLPDELRGRIYALLNHILRLGRSMEINQRPPYEALIAAMSECHQLASITTTTTTLPESTTMTFSDVLM
jgi:serine/threonine protein kinase